ncbi:MAG: hypothetical protein WCR31_09020 [Treponema sp.]
MNRLYSLILSAAALIISSVFCSCSETADSALRTEPITFTLPVWPPENAVPYPQLLYWNIQYYSGNSSGTFKLPVQDTTGASFKLEIQSGIPCAITAQPVTRTADINQVFFYPAGCIYPADSIISWENGFPASVCMQLYRSPETDTTETSAYLGKFNWKKFCSMLAAKEAGDGSVWNPWMLDKTAICRAIAARSFRTTLLTIKNFFSIETAVLYEKTEKSSDGTDIGMLFIPRYIPLFKRQRETETILLKKGTANIYLYNMQETAIITGTSGSNMTLEITAVPLYTEK